MKVSELSGAMLDLWVAKAVGCRIVAEPASGEEKAGTAWLTAAPWIGDEEGAQPKKVIRWGLGMFGVFSPSTNWGDGGPIFEREGFGICKFYEPTDGPIPEGGEWCALWRDDSMRADGPTPLIAGMRLFVMSKFGEEVPEE